MYILNLQYTYISKKKTKVRKNVKGKKMDHLHKGVPKHYGLSSKAGHKHNPPELMEVS